MPKKADKRKRKRRQQHQAARSEQRREVRRLLDERIQATTAKLRRLLDAARDDAVPTAQVASEIVEVSAGDEVLSLLLRNSETVVSLAEEAVAGGLEQRAVDLARALGEHLGEHPGLGELAVSLAEQGGEFGLAAELAEGVLASQEAGGAPDGEICAGLAAELAHLRWQQGRLGEAFAVMSRWSAAFPADTNLQTVQARLVAQAAALESDTLAEIAGVKLDLVTEEELAAASAAVARLADRSPLYRLRDAVEAFIEADPLLAERRERFITEFSLEVRRWAEMGQLDELDPALADLAAERFWLDAGEEGEEDEDEDEDEEPAVLERFASHPGTPPELAAAARAWSSHVRYGLWLGEWQAAAEDGKGLWLTDIVTRREVFTFMAPEQLEGVARWTVLAGAIAPNEGVWRSGRSLLALDPDLADSAADSLLHVTDELVVELAREHGMKVKRPGRRPAQTAYGVLSEVLEERDAAESDVISKVIGGSLAQLAAMAESARRRPPKMRNTDGDELEVISATFPVEDPDRLRSRLVADPDFREAGQDDLVLWLGREMSREEAAGVLAQARSQMGDAHIEEPTEPQRWTRGALRFEGNSVRLEVNSRARFESVATKLRALGAGEPSLAPSVDPAMDLPLGAGPLLTGRSMGPEADEAWMETWITESIPALGGLTPAKAAEDPTRAVLLEKLLRKFEHDADLVRSGGGTAMDIERLREKLGMQEGVLGLS